MAIALVAIGSLTACASTSPPVASPTTGDPAGATATVPSTASPSTGSAGAPAPRPRRPLRPHITSGNAKHFVLRAGDLARGSGLVVAAPGKPVRFCAPAIEASSSGPSARCAGLDVTGVDLRRLSNRTVRNGVVEGSATLTGTYRPGRLTVTRQRAAMPPDLTFDNFVPCATPPGGWPHGQPSLDAVTRYKRMHPGSIVELAYLNPDRRHSLVYVLTSGSPGPVDRALRLTYGRGLCVEKSRYSIADVRRGGDRMRALVGPGALFTPFAGGGIRLAYADSQPSIDIMVAILDRHVAGDIDSVAPGLVEADVWLIPVGRSAAQR